LKNITGVTEALIVEDEIDICFLLTGILKKKNVQTTFVNSISEAQMSLKRKSPSILFLDNNLPDGSGVDFIQQIKHSSPLTRIVVITADDTIVNKDKALHAGADFFIGKPFTRNSINNTIDMLMTENHL